MGNSYSPNLFAPQVVHIRRSVAEALAVGGFWQGEFGGGFVPVCFAGLLAVWVFWWGEFGGGAGGLLEGRVRAQGWGWMMVRWS